MSILFNDRLDAGYQLAGALNYLSGSNAVVLGLARGGVAVGYALATDLGLPLRALVVRKIRAPDNPELALGAVSETGERWLDPRIVDATGATPEFIRREIELQVAEARRRQQEYGNVGGLAAVRSHPAIVVDDGIATGSSALVAVRSARSLGASEVMLAVPVASAQAVESLRPTVDELVALSVPDRFLAVGCHYRRFDQLTDEEVLGFLTAANVAGRGEATQNTSEKTSTSVAPDSAEGGSW